MAAIASVTPYEVLEVLDRLEENTLINGIVGNAVYRTHSPSLTPCNRHSLLEQEGSQEREWGITWGITVQTLRHFPLLPRTTRVTKLGVIYPDEWSSEDLFRSLVEA